MTFHSDELNLSPQGKPDIEMEQATQHTEASEARHGLLAGIGSLAGHIVARIPLPSLLHRDRQAPHQDDAALITGMEKFEKTLDGVQLGEQQKIVLRRCAKILGGITADYELRRNGQSAHEHGIDVFCRVAQSGCNDFVTLAASLFHDFPEDHPKGIATGMRALRIVIPMEGAEREETLLLVGLLSKEKRCPQRGVTGQARKDLIYDAYMESIIELGADPRVLVIKLADWDVNASDAHERSVGRYVRAWNKIASIPLDIGEYSGERLRKEVGETLQIRAQDLERAHAPAIELNGAHPAMAPTRSGR